MNVWREERCGKPVEATGDLKMEGETERDFEKLLVEELDDIESLDC